MTDYSKLHSKDTQEVIWKHLKRSLQIKGVATSEVTELSTAISEYEDSFTTLPSMVTITTDDPIASAKVRVDDSLSDYTFDGNAIVGNSGGTIYVPLRCSYTDGEIVEERNIEVLTSGDVSKAKFEGVMDGNNIEYELYKTTFQVLDSADSEPLAGAQVSITDGNSLTNPAVTDASGLTDHYLLDGDYSFTVSKTGYTTSTEADFTVDGATQTVSTSLVEA